VASHEGVKGGANKPWRPRYRVSRKRGASLELRPIDDDPVFKIYMAKFNRSDRPIPLEQPARCGDAEGIREPPYVCSSSKATSDFK